MPRFTRPNASPSKLTLRLLTLVGVLLAAGAPSGQERRAEGPRPITAADYARAEHFLGPGVNPLVIGGQVTPNWLSDDRFWYRNQVSDGYEFILVDPVARTRKPAFDHARLAAALSAAARGSYTAHTLPFQSIELSGNMKSLSFDLNARRWTCDVLGARCTDTGIATGRSTAAGAGRPAGRGQ